MYDEFINKCFLEMDKDFLTLLNISQEELETEETFKKYLIEAGTNRNTREYALNIYKKKRAHANQEKIISKFVEVSTLEVPKTMTPEKYKKLYSYLKEVEELDENHPLKHFVDLSVALRTDNNEWIKRVSLKIINTSSLQYAIFIDPKKLSKKIFIQLVEALFDTLKLTKSKIEDPMITKMLVTRLTFFLPNKYKSRFKSEFNGNWSLNELREAVSNRKYGQSAIGLWFNVLENRTTEAEVNRFLDKILRVKTLKKLPVEEFWILKHFYPGGERRAVIEKRLASFNQSRDSVHDKLILNEILSKEPIKKKLEVIDPKFKKPLFKVKRDLFQSVLQSGYPSQFALYNLFLLGEKDPKLFWWFIL